ncbi:Cell cycle serine/threonine-protein kinase cdc5/MSD2 [Teratosphaeriaceae sp. CCFEE 6253]|nr:Cell cycle serine/threonine-protein kinase cdc5/MSD2 [Teratosphaeriaceae sp. CCFEE 6253]
MSSIHADPPPPLVTEPGGIHYATGSALGKGGFAICHRAERYDGSKPTGHMVALKIVRTKMEPAKLAQKFVSELQIHSKLSHPNIVAFYRAFSFQTSTYVVLELCPNGSLADMLKKRRHLTLPEIRRFVIQICGAVKYLHHRHIVHRDLKTGNLFLDEGMNVKVGDFGLAALLVTEKEMEVKRRTTMCGTPNYLAPEILEKGKGHDEKVDLWAIGVIAFTLAVGKAPFHAATKEEIYKKLRSGTYTWPELSATNNQSADLRNLVASLLVPEEQRPPPDQIVSQNFFKIAFVPASIPSTARERAPTWTEVSVPSADTIRRGYSDTWFAICKESGVGEYAEGKGFALNGGRRVKSVVHDMAREAQLGTQPTMPIPKDVVYISTVSSWDAPVMKEPRPVGQERRPPSRNRGLKELSHNEVAATRPRATAREAARDAELMPPPARPAARDTDAMPPPSRPSSRAGRSNTTRKAGRTISEETAKSSEPVRIASDESGPVLQIPKTRQAPLTATAALKALNTSSSSSTSRFARSQQTSESDAEKPKRAETVKRSADASLARRPRAPSRTQRSDRPISPDVPGPFATLDELAQVSPFKRPRKKQAEAESVEIPSDPEPELQSEPPALFLPPPPPMTRRLPVPCKTSANSDCIAGTDPDTVLDRLHALQQHLSRALHDRPSTSSSSTAKELPAPALPFVSRWVDYSRKHGVGYVMSDGTVGCIINASAKNRTPVTHLLVRNGQRWLSRVGKKFERVDAVPLEILEDKGAEGIRRKVYKGLGSVSEGPLAAEAERRRTLGVLWVKFGRYMCSSLDGDEAEGGKDDGNFVRFYQRIGSVGIWAFADGSLQVHFPDHTKLVLSPSGTHLSATCLTPEATSYLASHADLLPHHVGSRETFANSVQALLHEGGRVRARIVKANAVAEKLGFVLRIVEEWVRNEGLGMLDADESGDEGGYGTDGLRWDGLAVGGAAKKVDRVSVGRYGGDDLVKA